MGKPTQHSAELAQRLGLWTAVSIVIGSVIGSGIFLKPASMAARLGDPGLLILVWIITGVMTLFGALTNAEIAGMIHAAGGQYVFFRRIYNDFIGFIYGWAVFLVIQTGSIASIAVAFGKYLGFFFPLPHLSPVLEAFTISIPFIGDILPLADIGTKLAAIAVILFLMTVNYFGVAFGGFVQNLFTSLKVLAIGAIVILGFAIGHGSTSHFFPLFATAAGTGMIGLVTLSMADAFWAYDGWNNVTYVAAEIKNPQRNVPLALAIGTLAVIGIYVLTNLAYLYVLPIGVMAGSQLVAADVAQKFLGNHGAEFVAAAVLISTFGTVNGTSLASARVYYAMAKDRLFFRKIADVHPKYRTPGTSLVLQGIWASLLTLTGTFDQLTTYVIFASWVFYALGAFGVFVLRRKMPDAPRPYKVWGYPWVPGIFVLFAIAFVVITLKEDPRDSLMGLALIALGIPGYLFWKSRQRNAAAEHD